MAAPGAFAQAQPSGSGSAAGAPAKKPAGSSAAQKGIDPALLNPSTLKARAPDEFDVKFVATNGEFVVHVTRAWAPLGADRFYNLVKNGFYDDVYFFRTMPNFMVQFGMSGTPKIEAAWGHATIKDDPVKQGNARGRISFAMGGPNTRTTQVFINFKDNSRSLDSQGFAAFGEVTEGMDVVDKLYGGYGDMQDMGGRGPSPGRIAAEGNAYLLKYFPQLDRIKTAKIVP